LLLINSRHQAWWYTPAIPALRRLSQEDLEFKVSLGYIVRPCLKKNQGYDKSTASIILNGEKLKPFPKIRNQTRMPTISTPIQHSTGIPSQSN
jgi:hypothetical protein